MSISTKVTTTEKGNAEYQAFLNRFKRAKTAFATVGVHENAGSYQNGVEVWQVALWNEFGTAKTPERSFVRSSIDENTDRINGWKVELMGKVIDGKINLYTALKSLGERVQILIQSKIRSGVAPVNADSTIAQKIRDGVEPITLMHTKLMLRSITNEVVGVGESE